MRTALDLCTRALPNSIRFSGSASRPCHHLSRRPTTQANRRLPCCNTDRSLRRKKLNRLFFSWVPLRVCPRTLLGLNKMGIQTPGLRRCRFKRELCCGPIRTLDLTHFVSSIMTTYVRWICPFAVHILTWFQDPNLGRKMVHMDIYVRIHAVCQPRGAKRRLHTNLTPRKVHYYPESQPKKERKSMITFAVT
jgi:hypothetical protein